MVTTGAIAKGEGLDSDNCWVKRPGTGQILAADYEKVLGHIARRDLAAHVQIGWDDLSEDSHA